METVTRNEYVEATRQLKEIQRRKQKLTRMYNWLCDEMHESRPWERQEAKDMAYEYKDCLNKEYALRRILGTEGGMTWTMPMWAKRWFT